MSGANRAVTTLDRVDGRFKNAAIVPEKSHRNSLSSIEEIEVRLIDPLTDASWDRAVSAHPQSNIFHSGAWARVLNKTYGHTPTYLQFCHRQTVSALIPFMEIAKPFMGRRGVSLPFSDFCQPLLFGELDQQALSSQLVVLGRMRKWRHFEIRGNCNALPNSAVACERYYGHSLNLTLGLDKIFNGFQSSVRRAIRKAERSGIVSEISNSWQAVADFYKLHVRTRRRHGLPPQSLSFFRNIHAEIIEAGLGFVVLARQQLRPIAAAIFFHSGDEGLYKFGASDQKLWELRANNWVMWQAIKKMAASGLKRLHFGRTAESDHGLRRFKLSWGTEEQTIEYFRFALGTGTWDDNPRNGSGFYTQVFARMPLAVNRLAGFLIYPYLD